MRRRTLLLSTAGVAAAAFGGYQLFSRPKPRPRADFAGQAKSGLNILFVLTDQERSWDQYPAGFIEDHCPGRTKLLERGTYIDGAHTPVQLCSMARGVCYTGVHAQNNGVWENVPIPTASDLSPSLPTLGTMMQDAGYRTGYAGKWHLTKLHPRNVPLPHEEVQRVVRSYGFDETETKWERDGAAVGLNEDGMTVQEALGFIHRNKRGEKPWFLAVNLLNPHDVMYYTSGKEMTASRASQFPDKSERPPTTGLYRDDLQYEVLGHWGMKTRDGRPAAIDEYAGSFEASMGTMPLDDPDVAREYQNFYWNCTRDCDRHLNTLLEGLEASGEADRTVIVFTSDHGEYLGVHGLRGKGVSQYREASKIPMIIVHPDGRRSASVEKLVSQIDIAPTLLSFAGVDANRIASEMPQLVGYDIGGLAGAAGAQTRRDSEGLLTYWTSLAFTDARGPVVFAEALEEQGLAQLWAQMLAVREVDWQKRGQMRGAFDGRWKFSRYFSANEHHIPESWEELVARNDIELYDTLTDPDELVNLARAPEHQADILRMNAMTNSLIQREVGADKGNYIPFFAS